jgi:hypothetical protein
MERKKHLNEADSIVIEFTDGFWDTISEYAQQRYGWSLDKFVRRLQDHAARRELTAEFCEFLLWSSESDFPVWTRD